MKSSIASSPYIRRYGFAGAMARIKELGYDGIDYQGFLHTEDPLFQQNDSGFEKTLAEELKIVTDNGLKVIQAHGPWRFPPQDATVEDRAERFEKMVRSIHGAAILDCPFLVIHPLMPWGCSEFIHAEEVVEINAEFMGRLAAEAQKYNVTICYENMPMPQFPIGTPQQCLDLVKLVNNPNLKMCLDTGHCTMCNITPADAARLLGKEYLKAMHIHDNNGISDFHWLPFSGVIDWHDLKKALQEIGFEGAVSVETEIPKSLPEELQDIQDRALAASA